jgi:probable HAF family extracellular repeat protein
VPAAVIRIDITMFDAPGAGTGANQGTAPTGISPSGVIVGLCTDANGVAHAFLLTP